VSATLLLLTLTFAQAGSPGAEETDSEKFQSAKFDNLCGTRCVHRVLELHHKKADFLELATELQGPKVDRQASLLDLAEALRKRGIYARMVRFSPLAIPSWPQPIIMHVNGNHFVVLERGDITSGYVWDGWLPLRTVSWWEIKSTSSPVCLLTSATPIDEASSYTRYEYRYAVYAACVGLVIVGSVVFLRNRRNRQPALNREVVVGSA
jgi:ABC-type bacteriocin/lantibiotic exporter with double-glycine peptidase domain